MRWRPSARARRWLAAVGGFVGLALLGGGLLAPTPALLVEGVAGGRVLARLPIVDAPVTLRYRHSLYDAPAEEEFEIVGGALALRRLRSPRLAVLDYYARPEPIRASGDQYQIDIDIDDPSERRSEVRLLVSPIGQRTLAHGGRTVALHELPTTDTDGRVRVRIGSMPAIARWWEDLAIGDRVASLSRR